MKGHRCNAVCNAPCNAVTRPPCNAVCNAVTLGNAVTLDPYPKGTYVPVSPNAVVKAFNRGKSRSFVKRYARAAQRTNDETDEERARQCPTS